MVIVIAQCYRAARFERHWVMRFGNPWCRSPPEALCVPGRPETGPTGGRTVTVGGVPMQTYRAMSVYYSFYHTRRIW